MISRRKNVRNEAAIATYLHRKSVQNGIPLAGNFEITSRCNFSCKMCYVRQEHEKELTAEEWIELGREAKEKGITF